MMQPIYLFIQSKNNAPVGSGILTANRFFVRLLFSGEILIVSFMFPSLTSLNAAVSA